MWSRGMKMYGGGIRTRAAFTPLCRGTPRLCSANARASQRPQTHVRSSHNGRVGQNRNCAKQSATFAGRPCNQIRRIVFWGCVPTSRTRLESRSIHAGTRTQVWHTLETHVETREYARIVDVNAIGPFRSFMQRSIGSQLICRTVLCRSTPDRKRRLYWPVVAR